MAFVQVNIAMVAIVLVVKCLVEVVGLLWLLLWPVTLI